MFAREEPRVRDTSSLASTPISLNWFTASYVRLVHIVSNSAVMCTVSCTGIRPKCVARLCDF